MGFFDKLFKGNKGHELNAPLDGRCVSLKEVPDPTFSEGMMGQGVAIVPSSELLCAPCDATVDVLFDTGHAVCLKTEFGADILIHLGLETVSLKGQHFSVKVKVGDHVKAGEPLIAFELEALKAAGFNMITPVLVCNSDEFASVDTAFALNQTVTVGTPVLRLKKH